MVNIAVENLLLRLQCFDHHKKQAYYEVTLSFRQSNEGPIRKTELEGDIFCFVKK